ncbi:MULTISPECIES: CAP domain-containing protein [Streptomyces]|uniref:CAP domain-containing protein n=1 Tax=Streptomyces glycanivorans TaxID=3033808 RepID=A0ABY9J7V1_9ACTN|nr:MULTISPECIES: CAP domain-containing protein [unclassified Streptomyces]WLQ63907.1 CAP domain-containing protein [Streptomyces sp. Alt3]WSR09261.1 CAP domain-containing protein [Streptomyces sp. NBC_01208]WSR48011.1 CAP domain-containing protein [Streptomyces sp. NBC_01201]
MGRHRRAGAAPAAEQHAAGTEGGHHGARRKKRAGIPVRAGLLGVSAAVAVGAVAVASGLLPGGDTYSISGGGAADQVHAGGAPDLLTQGESSDEPTGRTSASAPAEADRGAGRSAAPSKSPSATPSAKPSTEPSASASKSASKAPERTKAPAAAPKKSASSAPATRTPAAPKPSSATPTSKATPSSSPSATSAQAAVLALVNQERAKVGCSPVTTSAPLTALAQDFSEDMAARDFFGHTDPDGATPWDRAAAAGVEGLGGENIARGQADAQAVMDAWMNSEGHRANILNCDYRTLGVGVHLGSGGPWWTQDFGF